MLFSKGADAAGAFESIASVNPTSGATSITFSSIPQTYQHLQIRYIGKSTIGTTGTYSLDMQINGDTGSNYAWHLLEGDGASTNAANKTGEPDIPIGRVSRAGENPFGVGIIDVHDYSSTAKNTTVRSFVGADFNGSGTIQLRSGLWLNTNAVTSITLFGTSFNSNSTFSLYGIKAA